MKCLSLQNKILLYLMTMLLWFFFVCFFYTSDFSVYFQVFQVQTDTKRMKLNCRNYTRGNALNRHLLQLIRI